MKKTIFLIVVAVVCGFFSIVSSGLAQGTAFTYQGQIYNGSNPANGSYDFEFNLYTVSSGGVPVTGSDIVSDIGASNGVFLATINFGTVFNGANYWLDIAVRTNGGTAFVELTPRQAITPTPYAIYAEGTSAGGLVGTVPLAQLPGAVVTNSESGATLSNLNLTGSLTLSPEPTVYFKGGLFMRGDESDNFFAGQNAGNLVLSGYDNVGIGTYALSSLTSGKYNTGVGELTLKFNPSGSANTALGAQALYLNGVGSGNTAIGYCTLFYNSTGSNNSALGDLALAASTNDSDLVAIGYDALEFENAFGQPTVSRFGENTAVGYQALQEDTQGYENTAVGFEALENNTTGYGNTAIGDSALISNIVGRANVAVGFQTLQANVANGNTSIGYQAMFANTSGAYNIAVGFNALYQNQSGVYNTAVGDEALYANTTGTLNTAVGSTAMALNTTGSSNTAVGEQALFLNTTGSNNAALGYQALESMNGSCNAAFGHESLWAARSGNNNTAFGCYALGMLGADNLNGGSNNIALGYQAGYSFLNTESGNIDIGNAGVAGDNNITRIGTQGIQTACYLAGTVYANGTFVSSSDRNAKKNIQSVDTREVLEKVAAMPVSRWNYRENDKNAHIGPMAQDFYSAFNVGPDEKHITTIDEGGVALAAIQGLNQKLQEEAKTKDIQIENLKQENGLLAQRLSALEQMVQALAQRK